MSRTALKRIKSIKTDTKLIHYIKNQIRIGASLEKVQKSLSNINISLSERVKQDRAKR
ncbi:MAG: hypothetical protein WA277_04740 [Nitrospirota bacterium]